MERLRGVLTGTGTLSGGLRADSYTLSGTVRQATTVPYYRGAYEVTPTNEAQVLPTSAKIMTQDLVIDPIPSNYGLITWNGSVLTVS